MRYYAFLCLKGLQNYERSKLEVRNANLRITQALLNVSSLNLFNCGNFIVCYWCHHFFCKQYFRPTAFKSFASSIILIDLMLCCHQFAYCCTLVEYFIKGYTANVYSQITFTLLYKLARNANLICNYQVR